MFGLNQCESITGVSGSKTETSFQFQSSISKWVSVVVELLKAGIFFDELLNHNFGEYYLNLSTPNLQKGVEVKLLL